MLIRIWTGFKTHTFSNFYKNWALSNWQFLISSNKIMSKYKMWKWSHRMIRNNCRVNQLKSLLLRMILKWLKDLMVQRIWKNFSSIQQLEISSLNPTKLMKLPFYTLKYSWHWWIFISKFLTCIHLLEIVMSERLQINGLELLWIYYGRRYKRWLQMVFLSNLQRSFSWIFTPFLISSS
jgi:hypothetical protein